LIFGQRHLYDDGNKENAMKVVRSKRLNSVLKDPKAAEQLRAFLASATLAEPSSVEITVKDGKGKSVRYVPKLVRVAGSGA
jgi:hypothetical protein